MASLIKVFTHKHHQPKKKEIGKHNLSTTKDQRVAYKAWINICAESRSSFLAIEASSTGNVKRHHNAISFLQKLKKNSLKPTIESQKILAHSDSSSNFLPIIHESYRTIITLRIRTSTMPMLDLDLAMEI